MRVLRWKCCSRLLLVPLAMGGCSRQPPAAVSTPSRPLASTFSAGPRNGSGHHDKTDCNWVFGWSWDMDHADAVMQVDVYDGNVLLGTVAADKFRRDLFDGGVGTGKYGFSFCLPATVRDGKPHVIRVRIHGSNTDLADTPKTITCPPQ
jgi:hypothetical protein